MRAILFSGLSLVSFLAACAGTTVLPGSTTGTSSGTGATGGGTTTSSEGDGGCITPTVGEACSDSSPPACQPPDPCCTGYEWSCDTTTGTWQQLGLGCACQPAPPPLPCGPNECYPGQYCLVIGPDDPDGGASGGYKCLPVPGQCADVPNCTCVEALAPESDPSCSVDGGGTSCTDLGNGNIRLGCQGG